MIGGNAMERNKIENDVIVKVPFVHARAINIVKLVNNSTGH